MPPQENFLLRQLAALEADLDRFDRLLDGLRLLAMRERNCSDVEAELALQEDRTWKQVRRQQAAARRAWLSFHRTLEKLRKAARNNAQPNNAQSNDAEPASPSSPPPAPPAAAPQPPPPAAVTQPISPAPRR
jgi:hypothetical protein